MQFIELGLKVEKINNMASHRPTEMARKLSEGNCRSNSQTPVYTARPCIRS